MKRRIIVCLAALLALFLLGNAVAMLCLRGTTQRLGKLAESHQIQSLRAELSSGAVRIEADLLASLATDDHSLGRYQDNVRRFHHSLQACQTCHHERPVQAQLDEVTAIFGTYQARLDRMQAGRPGDDGARLRARTHEAACGLVARTTELADLAQRHLEVRSSVVATGVQNAWRVLVGTFVTALVVGGVVAFHLKNRLMRPVGALLDGIERVRTGDVGHRVTIQGDEEFQKLASAFNQAYKSLQDAQESILQAEKMAAVGKFAAGVAHEVGNPLASISSVAQMMRRQSDTPEQRERIQLIMDHIGRITRVVRELLTFSRPAGAETLGRVEIGALLEHATTLLQYDKRAERVRISCRHDTDLRPVHGNADRLLLVFTNIMINALDALSDQSGEEGFLMITAQQRDDGIVIHFEDNGPGMAPEHIRNAFEPFFTTKEPGAGTGLGLWVCYQVIRKHHGTIRIDSRLGQGTTVSVELPCVPAPGTRTVKESQESFLA